MANRVAANSPLVAILCKRVLTLPRISTTPKSGRMANTDIFRRVLLVATTAPVDRSFSELFAGYATKVDDDPLLFEQAAADR